MFTARIAYSAYFFQSQVPRTKRYLLYMYDETFQPANLGTWEDLFEGLCSASATFAEACRENTCSFASIHTPQLRQLSLSHVTLLLHLSNWAISTGSNNIARRDVSRASLAITTKLRLLWQRGSSLGEAPISNINTVVSTPVFALPLSATHTIQSAAFTQSYKFFVEQFLPPEAGAWRST